MPTDPEAREAVHHHDYGAAVIPCSQKHPVAALPRGARIVTDDPYQQARKDAILFRFGGSPAKSAATWLSAIDKAERDGRPCPSWAELERLAPSLPDGSDKPSGGSDGR